MKKAVVRAIALLVALMLAVLPGQAGFKFGLSAQFFSIADATYKDIYGGGGPAFGASATLVTSKVLEIRAEIDSFKDTGAMIPSGRDLTLTLRPVFLSVRLTPVALGRFRPYAGAGLGTMAIRENYPEGISDYSESTTISQLEAGVYVRLAKRIDLAAGFRFMNAKSTSSTLDQTVKLGGIRPSMELSYTF
jgi:opacity protein-like surface antigen